MITALPKYPLGRVKEGTLQAKKALNEPVSPTALFTHILPPRILLKLYGV